MTKKSGDNYIKVNKESWNKRTEAHFTSDFYDVKGFVEGKSSLKTIELGLLGDIKGKSLLHLQCHFGQDTISLSRLGAQCTGVDFSTTAIDKGQRLASSCDENVDFICSDLYDLGKVLSGDFDIVFTSYGTIGWLPDLDNWASIIGKYLKKGGRFIMADFHPVLWMLDDDFSHIKYSYFNRETIIENENSSYTDHSDHLNLMSITWNHSIADILNALTSKGINIEVFNEYDYSPYNCFAKMTEVNPGQFQIEHLQGKLPMVYSILGRKDR